MQKKIQMNDDKISSSKQPKIYRTKKAVIIVVGKKTQNQKESATFFRCIQLCADDKPFWTNENTNSTVQNQKTTFDRLEHSAISKRLHI